MINKFKSLIIEMFNKIIYSQLQIPNLNINKDISLERFWKHKNPMLYDKNVLDEADNCDLTIIIPLYNSSKYIDILVSMLIDQKTNYKYEIIFVDDGSTDSTLEIISKYEKQYPSLIRTLRKPNSGISDARNLGLVNSKGRYIGFMDHDDKVDSNYINELLSAAYSYNANIVKCKINVKDQSETTIETLQDSNDAYTTSDFEKLFNLSGYIWGGIFSRELFKNLRFPKSFWYEDMITRFILYPRSNLIINTNKTTYFKYEHESNASKKVWSSTNYKCLEQYYLIEDILCLLDKFGIKKTLYIFMCLLDESSGTTVYRIKRMPKKIKKKVFMELRKLIVNESNEDYLDSLDSKSKAIYSVFKNNQYYKWILTQYLF